MIKGTIASGAITRLVSVEGALLIAIPTSINEAEKQTNFDK